MDQSRASDQFAVGLGSLSWNEIESLSSQNQKLTKEKRPTMVAVRALLLILLSAPTIRGRTNLPTLPEAIRLFQVGSTNKLIQTIQDQESVIAEQQARIAELENDVATLDVTRKGCSGTLVTLEVWS